MKPFYYYFLAIATTCFGCHKTKQSSVVDEASGIYVSGTDMQFETVTMYVSPAYNALPITDTNVISGFLRRRGITGFVFNPDGLPFNGRIVVTLNATNGTRMASIQSVGSGPNMSGKIDADGPSRDVISKDSIITIVATDSIPFSSISTDSCLLINAGISGTYYKLSSVGINKPYVYHLRYPVQYSKGILTVHLMNAAFIRGNGNTCSNVIKDGWGYNIMRYVFAIPPSPLQPGDTSVVQTRFIPLVKRLN